MAEIEAAATTPFVAHIIRYIIGLVIVLVISVSTFRVMIYRIDHSACLTKGNLLVESYQKINEIPILQTKQNEKPNTKKSPEEKSS